MHITAPGIDVTLAGEPRRVRQLLDIITEALEAAPRGPASRGPLPEGQVVEPSELDETDSPYALPEAEPLVRPAAEATYELPGRGAARRRRHRAPPAGDGARPLPRAPSLALEERPSEPPTRLPTPDAEPPLERTPVDDEPDPERTAVEADPRAPDLEAAEIEVTDTRAPAADPPSGATVEAPRARLPKRSSS